MRWHRIVVIVMLLVGLVPLSPGMAQADELCFPETNQCLSGRFRQYWEQHGGLAVFGFPITGVRDEQNRDTGQTYRTQWFERNRFEWHPENQSPYDVLLGRLGDDGLRQQGITWQDLPRHSGGAPGCLWFEQTQLNVCDQASGFGFRNYWEHHGLRDPALDAYGQSLAIFGLPLTPMRMETNASGDTVLTQWFERARFEWHPNNPDQHKVLLGLLGNEVTRPTAPPADPPPAVGEETVTVTNVVDGDTIDVLRAGETKRVRFIGMDTPEIHGNTECYGQEASAYTRERLSGKTVRLEKDVSETDRFGRLLRYVWLDGVLYNEQIVRDGYAHASSYPPDVKYQERIQAAERAAREAGAGLWSACQPPPSEPEPAPPSANCDPAYPDVCIPSPPPDLDCGDIPHRRFRVLPPDPHRFDGNRDGIGCES